MKIYIGNLSPDSTEQNLRDLVTPFGKTDSVALVMDKATGKAKGFGFAESRTTRRRRPRSPGSTGRITAASLSSSTGALEGRPRSRARRELILRFEVHEAGRAPASFLPSDVAVRGGQRNSQCSRAAARSARAGRGLPPPSGSARPGRGRSGELPRRSCLAGAAPRIRSSATAAAGRCAALRGTVRARAHASSCCERGRRRAGTGIPRSSERASRSPGGAGSPRNSRASRGARGHRRIPPAPGRREPSDRPPTGRSEGSGRTRGLSSNGGGAGPSEKEGASSTKPHASSV